MATKRKDNKGRVLKTGESQRKDGIYQYRYTDRLGKRHTIYHADLNKLREQETAITLETIAGYSYTEGDATVIDLATQHKDLKQNAVKPNTLAVYNKVIKRLKEDPFGHQPIRQIKMSDAKRWLLLLHRQGLGRSAITQIRNFLKPAFEMAVQDDILHKNPFNFKIDFIDGFPSPRQALSPDVINRFLAFVRDDPYASKYYDAYIVLLGTGLRIGELCGLTLKDVDMKLRRIDVNHQIIRKESKTKGTIAYITSPKSRSSRRIIPMSQEVYEAFKRIIAKRNASKVQPVVDGYSGFLFITDSGTVVLNVYISKSLWDAINRYNKTHSDQLPRFSPHNLRHTFCTNMLDAGADIKVVQYLMGHASSSITLDVYTHCHYDKVERELLKATDSVPKGGEVIPLHYTTTTPLLHQLAEKV